MGDARERDGVGRYSNHIERTMTKKGVGWRREPLHITFCYMQKTLTLVTENIITPYATALHAQSLAIIFGVDGIFSGAYHGQITASENKLADTVLIGLTEERGGR